MTKLAFSFIAIYLLLYTINIFKIYMQNNASSPPSSFTKDYSPYAIKVRNLRKEYGRFTALNGISFDVYPHEIFGFLGPNGSGKTTTIKCITTLTKPSEGSIEIFGVNALSHADQVRQSIGYVPQSLSLISELSGYENLLIYSKLYGVPKHNRHQNILHILELLGIGERGNDEVYKYSGGMMRRLEIGTAIVHNPPLVVLDEPTIGLDPQGRHIMWKLLRRLVSERGTTIFMTTHDMSEADDLCDRIAIINRGNIAVIDSPANLKSSVIEEEVGGEAEREGETMEGKVKGVGGEDRRRGDIVMIKTLTDPLAAISIVDREMGIKAKLVDRQHYPQYQQEQIQSQKDYQQQRQQKEERYLRLVLKDAKSTFPDLLSTFVKAGVKVESIDIQQPTLDDVFLKYAGTRIHEAEAQQQEEGDAGEEWKNIKSIRRRFTG